MTSGLVNSSKETVFYNSAVEICVSGEAVKAALNVTDKRKLKTFYKGNVKLVVTTEDPDLLPMYNVAIHGIQTLQDIDSLLKTSPRSKQKVELPTLYVTSTSAMVTAIQEAKLANSVALEEKYQPGALLKQAFDKYLQAKEMIAWQTQMRRKLVYCGKEMTASLPRQQAIEELRNLLNKTEEIHESEEKAKEAYNQLLAAIEIKKEIFRDKPTAGKFLPPQNDLYLFLDGLLKQLKPATVIANKPK